MEQKLWYYAVLITFNYPYALFPTVPCITAFQIGLNILLIDFYSFWITNSVHQQASHGHNLQSLKVSSKFISCT